METHCLICGDAIEVLSTGHQGYVEGLHFTIAWCPKCGARCALPRRDHGGVYELIYKNAQRMRGYNRYVAYASAVKYTGNPLEYLASAEPMYWAVKTMLASLQRSKLGTSGVLEIGCGLGYLTYAIAGAGIPVTGIDLSAVAVAEASARFGQLFRNVSIEQLGEESCSYHLIVLTEVIEHVPDPVGFLGAACKLIAPGGSILLTTPRCADVTGHAVWDTELPPVHWWWFTETSLMRMADKLNCDIQFIDFSEYHEKVFCVNRQDSSMPVHPAFYSDGTLLRESKENYSPPARELCRYWAQRTGLLSLYRRLRYADRRHQGRSSDCLAAVLMRKSS